MQLNGTEEVGSVAHLRENNIVGILVGAAAIAHLSQLCIYGEPQMEKSLDEILRVSKMHVAQPAVPQQHTPAEEIKLPVWEFTSDLVNTFMLNGKPISLPYRTQNPFIASMLQREYVFNGILSVQSLPPEPIKYLSVRKGLA